MKMEMIIIIVCSCVIGLLIITVLAMAAINKKKAANRDDKVNKIKMVDGVRYTEDDAVVNQRGEVNVTHNVGDIILERGKVYKAKKGGFLAPGKYTVLSSDENLDAFNLKIGGYVREVKHFSSIVIAEGEEISPVSHTIILR